nr:probable serine/threonine-protein kinase At1g54610 [Solanum lycopersicum]
MGCVQAKASMHSPPRGLEKLKLESGYVGRGEHVRPRRSTGQRPHELIREKNAGGRRLSDANRDTITHEGEKKQTNDVGRKITKTTTTTHEEEELIDGWPKWLVDNIPREVLAGLVPKSADSYDKIDKVYVIIILISHLFEMWDAGISVRVYVLCTDGIKKETFTLSGYVNMNNVLL